MDYDAILLPELPITPGKFLRPEASPRSLIGSTVHNHMEWFIAQALTSGGEVRRVPGGGILTIMPDEITLAFPHLSEIDMPLYLDGLIQLCKERTPERIGCWARDPRGYGAIAAHLVARGFDWGWQSQWMALDLRTIHTDFPTPPGLRITVEDAPNWDLTDLPYYDARFAATLAKLSALRPRRIWHFAAWLDGKPVGHSLLLLSTGRSGVGGIYNVGVLPSARNQGIGRAITVAACVAARRCGAHHAVLNAATHIYERIGFVPLGRGQTWWLQPQTLQCLPSASEVAFTEALGRGNLPALTRLEPPADLDAPLACGLRPIQVAARCRKPAGVRWLVARGATLQVLDAWHLGWKKEAARLLRHHPELVNHRSSHWQMTPLHEAAWKDDRELAALLLTANPDLTITDVEFHGTPLGWARHFNRTEIIAMIEASRCRESTS